MTTFNIGDTVTAFYKTGKYIGEITAIRPTGSIVVKTLAVLKHPMQGDLHNPKQADVDFFHERKALSFREQTNVPSNMVKPYEKAVPDYSSSLREAVDRMKSELSDDTSKWAEQSLACLANLEKEYFLD